MKGIYFKHLARKQRYKFLMAERIRKHPCLYCPKKLLYLLRGKCDYASCGGFLYVHKNNESKSLYKVIQRCIYKYAPVSDHAKHDFEYKL